MISVDVNRLHLAEGTPTVAVGQYDYTLIGDVTERFTPRDFTFQPEQRAGD